MKVYGNSWRSPDGPVLLIVVDEVSIVQHNREFSMVQVCRCKSQCMALINCQRLKDKIEL